MSSTYRLFQPISRCDCVDDADSLRNVLECGFGQLSIETHSLRCFVEQQHDIADLHTGLAQRRCNYDASRCGAYCAGQKALGELQQSPVCRKRWSNFDPLCLGEVDERSLGVGFP